MDSTDTEQLVRMATDYGIRLAVALAIFVIGRCLLRVSSHCLSPDL